MTKLDATRVMLVTFKLLEARLHAFLVMMVRLLHNAEILPNVARKVEKSLKNHINVKAQNTTENTGGRGKRGRREKRGFDVIFQVKSTILFFFRQLFLLIKGEISNDFST